MTALPPVRQITLRELRQMFNDGNYEAFVESGKLRKRVRKEKHVSSSKADVPFCSSSQIVAYLDSEDNEVAIVHQYLKPNRTLGASGLPDPKRIFKDGILYVAWPEFS